MEWLDSFVDWVHDNLTWGKVILVVLALIGLGAFLAHIGCSR